MNLAKNLKIDSVSRLDPSPPLFVGPSQSVAEAIALMQSEGVGCLLVCENGKLLGLFTERDLMRRVLANGHPLSLPVQACMTPNPVVVHPKEPVAGAVRRMEEGGYRHLPIVDDAGHPLGILSVKRIMHYLVEHFPSTVYNLPPEPDNVPNQREGA